MTIKFSAPHRGFTLIELMITVAIVAVIAAIAVPSYASYVSRARRADAVGQLVQVAQFMQRFYAANDSFSKDRADKELVMLDQIPESLKQSPAQGAKMYELAIPADTLTSASFTIQMGPVAGGAMAKDTCGTFTLASTGVRGVMVAGAAGAPQLRDSCWK